MNLASQLTKLPGEFFPHSGSISAQVPGSAGEALAVSEQQNTARSKSLLEGGLNCTPPSQMRCTPCAPGSTSAYTFGNTSPRALVGSFSAGNQRGRSRVEQTTAPAPAVGVQAAAGPRHHPPCLSFLKSPRPQLPSMLLSRLTWW